VEGIQRLHGVADADAGKDGPVDLRLRPRRCLYAAPSTPSRSRIGLTHVALHRTQTAAIAVLGYEPGVQLREVERRILVTR
jgi:hypothetical protein